MGCQIICVLGIVATFFDIVATIGRIVATSHVIVSTLKRIVATSTVIVATIQFPPNSHSIFSHKKRSPSRKRWAAKLFVY
jgi:hypothetical protein